MDDKEALFQKYLAGQCSPEELAVLLDFFASRDDAELKRAITAAMDSVPKHQALQDRAAELALRVRERLVDQVGQHAARRRTRRRIAQYAAVAAAVALLITVGVLLFRQQPGGVASQTPASTFASAGDVPPGSDRAMLILPDGRTVSLNADKKGIRVDDSLRYQDGTTVSGLQAGTPKWLALATPRGGQYRLELPDGTHVWLNAASKLRYPTRFSGPERVVELEGEAYFHVHPQSEPFLVKTRSQTVTVLGTQFNVSAYHDDAQTVTTLVDGRVNVLLKGQQGEMGLVPGEQSIVDAQSFKKKQVDVAQFVNWKSGSFSFRETEIHHVMKQLSRWYDIEVVIDKSIPPTYFYGDIKRDKSLSQVLNILKEGGVNFRITRGPEGRRLMVVP